MEVLEGEFLVVGLRQIVGENSIIRLSDVEKSYGKGAGMTPVLRGVSLQVEKGEMVALVGQSGSGKSTLLNIIGGLDTADSGNVAVLGTDYVKANDKTIAGLRNKKIGFVFQSFNLLDHLNCVDNVSLPNMFAEKGGSESASSVRQRARESLSRVGLADYFLRTPAELSGGQKQRVAIARALFNQPELLLCDEPTGNLDSDTGEQVISFFQKLNKEDGMTLLVVTHEERVSSAARRIVRIVDGAIVDDSVSSPSGQTSKDVAAGENNSTEGS